MRPAARSVDERRRLSGDRGARPVVDADERFLAPTAKNRRLAAGGERNGEHEREAATTERAAPPSRPHARRSRMRAACDHKTNRCRRARGATAMPDHTMAGASRRATASRSPQRPPGVRRSAAIFSVRSAACARGAQPPPVGRPGGCAHAGTRTCYHDCKHATPAKVVGGWHPCQSGWDLVFPGQQATGTPGPGAPPVGAGRVRL